MSQTHRFPALLLKVAMLLSLVAVFPGCKGDRPGVYSPPKFKETVEEEFEVISDELFGLVVSDIIVQGSQIIVCGSSQEDGKIIHVYDKESGEPLMHTLNSGRGPKELIFPGNISFHQDTGTMFFVDLFGAKRLDVDVDRLVEEGLDAIEEIYWPISKWGRHHIILKDGSLSFNNVSLPQKDTSDTRRLELRDTAGDLISAYDKFPAIDEEWKRDMMYINDYVAVSPDEEKFAVVTSLGGILETFSIKDGELKNIATKYFVEPDFSMTKSKVGEVYSVSYDYDNLVKSFGDLYVTNDAVYAVYGGDRMFTSRTGSDNIAVFDWKGNPQKLIRTDYRIVTFFLDEEENTVYAVIWDSEMRPYIGRIRL